eukprot:TRINITY_DN3787_c0_g1_i3.p4 TRINITY_DN3787_c0_g1~~TRINITY_DN3787_c0_g1_i3.p4  ORF type:complete len:110 (-),score=23.77 TRINITY_DN3787_c0_g1_i3:1492-1821(-)
MAAEKAHVAAGLNGPEEPMKESHVEVKMPGKGAQLSEEGVIPLAATEGLNIFHLSRPNPFLKDLEPLKKAGLIPPGVYLYNATPPCGCFSASRGLRSAPCCSATPSGSS